MKIINGRLAKPKKVEYGGKTGIKFTGKRNPQDIQSKFSFYYIYLKKNLK